MSTNLIKLIAPLRRKFHIIIVGSILRHKENPKDIDLITLDDLNEIKQWLKDHYHVTKILGSGKLRLDLFIMHNGHHIQINIWRTTQELLPYTYFSYAYTKQFNIYARQVAKKKGLKLTQYGLFKNSKLIKIRSYKDIFKILDIPYRTPQYDEKRKQLSK
jgi:DNA polymerase (family 10)